MTRAFTTTVLIIGLAGCGNDPEPGFPADYAATYTEVRNCRGSLEHNFKYVRILASPDALEAYQGRTVPFPEGSVVLKEQYGEADELCAEGIVDFTVMVRLADGASPDELDWHWETVSADREVQSKTIKGCINCHQTCEEQSFGYAGTCAEP